MDKIITGINGLDEILYNGIPAGSGVLVEGPPGIGKTTFAMEYLVKGAWYYGEPGLYVSFEELPEQLYRDMARFDWGITDLEKKRRLRLISTSPDSFVSELLSGEGLLRSLIVELGIKRMVIDSVTLFQYRSDDEKEKRELLYSIRNALNKLGCTTLFISESFQENGQIHYAHFILDGVITLHLEKDRHQRIRKMEVKKLRGSDFVDGPCVWDITEKGITVILPKKLPKALPPHIPYIQTGIKKLDDYLGGGIVSGSRWLVNIDEISRYKMLLGSIFMERIKAGENFLCRLSPSTLVRDVEDYFSSQGYSLLEFAKNGRIYFIEQYKRPVPEELMPYIIRAYDSMDVDLYTLIDEKTNIVGRIQAGEKWFLNYDLNVGIAYRSRQRVLDVIPELFSLERHFGITSFVTCHSERTDNELMAIMKKSADGIIEIWTDDYQYVQVMKSPNGVVSKPMIMESTDYSTVVTLL